MSAILIVDDHAVMRSGLARIIKADLSDAVIGEASDAQEAERQIEAREWDLVVLDIGLPGRSGLEVLQEAQRMQPKLPVLILTGLPDSEIAIRVFEKGAMGYLGKDCSAKVLIDAVRKLLDGGRYLTASLAEKLAANLRKHGCCNPPDSAAEIKGRMFEVLLLLGRGDTVKAIAADLGLSIKTVSTYRARVMERLELKSNADIVRYCLRRGLTE